MAPGKIWVVYSQYSDKEGTQDKVVWEIEPMTFRTSEHITLIAKLLDQPVLASQVHSLCILFMVVYQEQEGASKITALG